MKNKTTMTEQIKGFDKEADFEEALIQLLLRHGWNEVIKRPTEDDLVRNWAAIIYDNNRAIDQLGNYPLTPTEMKQIIDKVDLCASPYDTNNFINARYVSICRDCTTDHHNYGKEVYLKIFDPKEISAGQSRYQIARQPIFQTSDPQMLGERRGDVMLLINGMPVIHIELKRSGTEISEATYQLQRYVHEGIFGHGILKLVQIFVAMKPEKTLYFANPGDEAGFIPQNFFHWADFNNEEVFNWERVAANLLSIPMAHQMVGYYTIADDKDHRLKVLRSYQFFAASKISDCVAKTNWDNHRHMGGYVWHTTGSGKTMTSFKSAQLIAASGDADKVVFLLDRIELAVQSLDEYRGFVGGSDTVQDTADTAMLIERLRSTSPDDRLIVTSIQKMSHIKPGTNITQALVDAIGRKRLVFIVDECHRSVFGEMLIGIRHTFPRALLFGFTGTPVFEVNAKNEITTSTLFGNEIHKYTIASGIPDGNVLPFDPYRVSTFDDDEVRELAAISEMRRIVRERERKRNPNAELPDPAADELLHLRETDEELRNVYDKMFAIGMPDTYNDPETGEVVHGVEHYVPRDLYRCEAHHDAVAQHIVGGWRTLSSNGKFHAMLATKNIPEAIEYYHIFKTMYPSMRVAAVFDNNIDNTEGAIAREDAIVEMLTDYNERYHTSFTLVNYAQYKKDVAKRLAHKRPYTNIEGDRSQQIDLLIVVTQMLTGYDSKWINTLYVDKVMKYVDIIQAFSRTNRLFGSDKPHGTIKYYAYPYTMEQNISDALEVYADRPLGIFVDRLETNLANINHHFLTIRDIFENNGISHFASNPEGREARNMFAKCFVKMTHLLEAAKLQGFTWEKPAYEFTHGDSHSTVTMELDEETHLVLKQRYRELIDRKPGEGDHDVWEYPIDPQILETGTGMIDAEYLNTKFRKYIKYLRTTGPDSRLTTAAYQELCKAFAGLSQRDQRTAVIILHDIQSGDLQPEDGMTLQQYISRYQQDELHKQILTIAEATGLNAAMFERFMQTYVVGQDIDEFARFSNLKATLDTAKATDFLRRVTGGNVMPFLVGQKIDRLLRDFANDPAIRAPIIEAWLNDDVTLDTAAARYDEAPVFEADTALAAEDETAYGTATTAEPAAATVPAATADPAPGLSEEERLAKIKAAVADVLATTLAGVSRYMRPLPEVIDSVFSVLRRPSLASLDSVDIYVMRAFENLYLKKADVTDKSVSFNLLVTKFEAYLRKLYYLMKGEEVQPFYAGESVTWKDVVHAIHPLWNLRYSPYEEYRQLYPMLHLVKGWRNEESHESHIATEAELDSAVPIVITMYFFATGACITDLEMAEA